MQFVEEYMRNSGSATDIDIYTLVYLLVIHQTYLLVC